MSKRSLILIFNLLKINTAYKLGRPDMIGKTRIFTMTNSVNLSLIFPEIAEKDGFQILLPIMAVSRAFLKRDIWEIW